jgi:protein-S-isoprenylcysteine O-methyltransferase Ste14
MSETDSAGVKFPPPLIFLAFLLSGYLIGQQLGPENLGLPVDIRRGIAFVLVIMGLLVDGVAVASLRRKGTAPEPWKPTSAIVDTGLFAMSRNPIYLGFTLTYLGFAVAMDSAIALCLILPLLIVIDRFVIAREEAYLERQFGETYRQYKQKVRRWL